MIGDCRVNVVVNVDYRKMQITQNRKYQQSCPQTNQSPSNTPCPQAPQQPLPPPSQQQQPKYANTCSQPDTAKTNTSQSSKSAVPQLSASPYRIWGSIVVSTRRFLPRGLWGGLAIRNFIGVRLGESRRIGFMRIRNRTLFQVCFYFIVDNIGSRFGWQNPSVNQIFNMRLDLIDQSARPNDHPLCLAFIAFVSDLSVNNHIEVPCGIPEPKPIKVNNPGTAVQALDNFALAEVRVQICLHCLTSNDVIVPVLVLVVALLGDLMPTFHERVREPHTAEIRNDTLFNVFSEASPEGLKYLLIDHTLDMSGQIARVHCVARINYYLFGLKSI